MSNLKTGDIVVASTVLGGEREFPVLSIDGNKARTAFRTFHKKIRPGGAVYEYGNKRTTNGYWVKLPLDTRA